MQITLKCSCMLVLTAGLSVLAPLQTTHAADKVDQKKRAATLKALAEVRKQADAIQENLDQLKAREASLQEELDSIEKVAVDKAKASQKEADAIQTRAAAAGDQWTQRRIPQPSRRVRREVP